MDLTIAERLVCPRPHTVTPLVVRADVTRDGRLMQGLAGCPVCHAEWHVHDGVLEIGAAAGGATLSAPDADSLAALMSLTEPGLLIVTDGLPDDVVETLGGRYGSQVLVLDGPSVRGAAGSIVGAERVPIAGGLAQGAALFRSGRSAGFVESMLRVLRTSGRVVAGDGVPVAPGTEVLVRERGLWVGERLAAPVSITPRRRD